MCRFGIQRGREFLRMLDERAAKGGPTRIWDERARKGIEQSIDGYLSILAELGVPETPPERPKPVPEPTG